MTTLSAHPAGDTPHTGDTHGHAHSLRPYVVIFVLLLALLGAAVGVAYVPTDDFKLRAILTVAAYTIATIKAVLIILYFMHVKEGSKVTWVFAGASFFWLAIMILLTLNDYYNRGAIPEAYKQALHSPYGAQALEHAP